MSYTRDLEITIRNNNDEELYLVVTYDKGYDAYHNLYYLETINFLTFDDCYGDGLRWDNVLKTFKCNIIDEIKTHVRNDIELSNQDQSELDTAKQDHDSARADFLYEQSRDLEN